MHPLHLHRSTTYPSLKHSGSKECQRSVGRLGNGDSYATARGDLDQAELHRYQLNGWPLGGGFIVREQDMSHICTQVSEDLACVHASPLLSLSRTASTVDVISSCLVFLSALLDQALNHL